MSIRGMFGNINRALGSTTPQQRAQMLAIAGGSSPSPTMGNALYGQSQAIMQALQDEARSKAQFEAQMEEQKFRAGEGDKDRQNALDQQAMRSAYSQRSSPLGKVNIADWTPDSGQAWLESITPENPEGNVGLLKRAPLPSGYLNVPGVGVFSTQPTRGGGTGGQYMGVPNPDGSSTVLDARGIGTGLGVSKSMEQQGVDAAKTATELADRLPVMSAYMSKLVRARDLVASEGAWTGQVAEYAPTFRDASTELKNIGGSLGLDVIAMQSFGQLSNAEREFAVKTALPTDLKGPALIDWVDRKLAAQRKIYKVIDESVQYLSVPGNTKAGLQEYFKAKARAIAPEEVSPENWVTWSNEDKDDYLLEAATRPYSTMGPGRTER